MSITKIEMGKGVLKKYRRAWRLFDCGLITHEKLLFMIGEAQTKIENVKRYR